MKKTHDLLANVGEYTDTQTGEKKKRRVNCGAVFEDDQGRRSIKIESLPVGPGWSGWLNEYAVKERDNLPPAGRYENAAAVHAARPDDEDLAF